jgi:uncharacterized phage protein gp47/JayE
MAGLDATGLTIKRFPEVVEDLVTSEQQNISPNIATEEDSVVGQFNTILGEAIAELWELAEVVNSNFDKDKAEGRNLDDLGDLIGVSRIGSSKSAGPLRVVAKDGVVFPINTILTSSVNDTRFLVTSSTIISSVLCYSATFSVAQVLNSTQYSLIVNDNTYLFTSDVSATANEIVVGLKAEIDADTIATWTATLSGDTLIITTSDASEIVSSSNSYLSVISVSKDVPIEAEEAGLLVVPANTVSVLISPISDVTSVTNLSALVTGRLAETDEEFRARFSLSGGVNGKSTLPAIRSQLLSTEGVSSVTVIENDTAVTDGEGLPPKSFESIVQGGADADIGATIWNNKPAGIATYGLSSVIIEDSIGEQRTINYTRPSVINIAVQVTYTLYAEETFPDNGDEQLADIILAHINNLGADVDVIPQRLFGPLYSGVTGLESLVVEIQTLVSPGDTPGGGSWVQVPIPIDIREFSQTTLTDITLVGP